MYLNHASTKDVINTQNQCQIWIYLKTTCCVQLNIVLWDRVNLNFREMLKVDTLRLQQLWKNDIFEQTNLINRLQIQQEYRRTE